jgi:mono/diheme cytochrome c family protein
MLYNLMPALIFQVVLTHGLGGCHMAGSADEPVSGLDAMRESYDLNCAQCHLNGESDGFSTPALRDSAVVNGPSAPLIDIVLHGQAGVSLINGRPGNGIMPSQDYLTDEEIAEILTFVRAQFGNNAPPISVEEVAQQRMKDEG